MAAAERAKDVKPLGKIGMIKRHPPKKGQSLKGPGPLDQLSASQGKWKENYV